MIKKIKNKRFFDSVRRVVISEYDKITGEVWLEVWCKNFIDELIAVTDELCRPNNQARATLDNTRGVNSRFGKGV